MKKLTTKHELGYTIVELLAVVSILVIISGIISGILYSTLRGASKTRITTEVTQNGNYAISIISNIIADSTSVTKIDGIDIADCTASPSGTSITVRRLSGETTMISCANNTISTGSASLINTNEVQIEDDTCFFYCSQITNDPYSIPVVGITFKIKDTREGLFESQSAATFETSVSIRNYSP